MAECNWDPNKHGGKPCPIHGSSKKSTDNPYSKGSLSDIEKQGWEGKHNYIINRMYNSDYDTIDEVMEDAERMDLDEKQMQYVEAVARRVFGENFEDEEDEPFDDDYDFDTWGSQAVSVAEKELGINALDSYENYDQVCDWLMDNGYAEDYDEADKMIKDSLSQEGWDKLNKIREEWGIDDIPDNDELFNEVYGQDDFDSDELIVDEIGPDKKEQKQIKKEIKQRKKEDSKEQAIDFKDKTRISKYMNEDGTASFTLDEDPYSKIMLRNALGKDGVFLLKEEDGIYTVAPGPNTTNEQFKNWLLNNTGASYKSKEEKLNDDSVNTSKKKTDRR